MLASCHVADADADTVELVVSELVTNAMRYAYANKTAAQHIRLSLSLVGSSVLVQVFDTSPVMPQLIEASPLAERGRGLQLVASLSSRWGAVPVSEDGHLVGKTVWALIPVRRAAGTETA